MGGHRVGTRNEADLDLRQGREAFNRLGRIKEGGDLLAPLLQAPPGQIREGLFLMIAIHHQGLDRFHPGDRKIRRIKDDPVGEFQHLFQKMAAERRLSSPPGQRRHLGKERGRDQAGNRFALPPRTIHDDLLTTHVLPAMRVTGQGSPALHGSLLGLRVQDGHQAPAGELGAQLSQQQTEAANLVGSRADHDQVGGGQPELDAGLDPQLALQGFQFPHDATDRQGARMADCDLGQHGLEIHQILLQ